MLVLCILFFAGVIAVLFSLRMKPPEYVYPAVAGFLTLMFVVQIILTIIKMKKVRFEFYPSEIRIMDDKPKTILLREIEEVTVNKNVLDKTFKTGSIQLGTKGRLDFVKNIEQTVPYTQKLVDMAKRRTVQK